MINLKLLETNYDEFVKKLEGKNVKAGLLDELLQTFNELKQKRKALENFQAIQNAKSKELGIKARAGEDVSELKNELNLNEISQNFEQNGITNILESYQNDFNEITKSLQNIASGKADKSELAKITNNPNFSFFSGLALGALGI